MAEQIRSFWSHLCGIFGAIFGMIAGGTLVTIERAGAEVTVYGSDNCRYASKYSTETLSNGAVVYSCYGGGWFCGKANGSMSAYYTYCGGEDPCYIMGNSYNIPRYYAYFLGCADGYYSASGTGYSVSVPVTSGVSSSTHIVNVTSGWGVKLHKDLTELDGVTSSVQGLDPHRSYATGTCTYIEGLTTASSSGKVFVSGTLPDGYDISALAATNGWCKKCPTYGEYLARSEGSTYAKNVSSCFMTSYVSRDDSADQPDGNATGQFIWTSTCKHDGTVSLAQACANIEVGVTDDACYYITVNSYSDEEAAVAWITEICGGGTECKNTAENIVDGFISLPYSIRWSMQCEKAKCYQRAAAADGVEITYSENS